MAETSYIIQNGRRLNLKDITARKTIGSCDSLQTETKHCLVDAINEVNRKVGGGGGGGGSGVAISPDEPTDGSVVWIDTDEEGSGGSGDSGGGVSLEAVYPVGSIYLSVLETDPATLFGFGTWERIKDKFLLSAGDTYAAGSEGGEAEHTLTVDEMPSHSHTGGFRDFNVSTGTKTLARPLDYGYDSELKLTLEAGGSRPHNNMPPYLAVYMWQRTA